jgi:hypothetical protein
VNYRLFINDNFCSIKVNGLVVEKYLVYLFDMLANAEFKEREPLKDYMPWSKDLPDALSVKAGK